MTIDEIVEVCKSVEVSENYLIRAGEFVFRRDTVYICCSASIGDTLFMAALVKSYKEKYAIDRVCFILKENQKNIADWYESIDECIVSNDLIFTLELYSVMNEVWSYDNYLYGHFKKKPNGVYFDELEIYQKMNNNMIARYASLIYDLSEYEIEYPVFIYTEKAKEFETRDVILMPYAQTAKMLPMFVWETLAQILIQCGFKVYTNVRKGIESIIKGTAELSEDINTTALICERCGVTIALRSGMCDILAMSEADIIILNTEKELSQLYDVNNIPAKGNVVNIECTSESEYEQMVRNVLSCCGIDI